MFDSIRNSRWVAFVVMLPVFLFFVISGVYGFMQFRQGESGVAKVDGVPITTTELDSAHRERLEQYRAMFGQNFDPKVFDTPRMRAATLDSLLSDRALESAVQKDHVLIADAQVDDAIRAIPAFQHDGKFDLETAKVMLQARGFSEAGFRARMRDDLGKETLANGVSESAFLPKEVVGRLWQAAEEKRVVRFQRFDAKDFIAKATLPADAAKTYYDAHPGEFKTPESIKAEYVVLTLDDVAATIAVSADDVKTYYEQNKSRYTEPEQRRASHILITYGKDGSAPDKESARRLAEDVLKKLRADAGQFEKIARDASISKDPGSASKGGDLGWFGRGMMVKPFEDAAFSLPKGGMSGVVESDFGFHIIKVTDAKGGEVKPFDDVRAQIEAELRKQQAQKSFGEVAEQFTNMVYEQSASLQPAADKFKLKIQTIDNLTRRGQPAAPGTPNVFGPPMVSALFGAESLAKKQNVPAVEVGASALASARVLDYRPAAVKPFDEVKSAIQADLLQREATRLARAAGEERLKALQGHGDETGFGAPQEISRDNAAGLPAASALAVFRVATDKLPAYAGVDLDGGYAVVEVVERKAAPTVDEQKRTTELASWTRQAGAADDDSYIHALRKRFDARILKPELALGAPGADPAEDALDAAGGRDSGTASGESGK
ncbi:MAG TPA: SurA N-terminal domain-containing protein [Burkholderiaceae bacterium]|nr:SurA N-terminal domain-containing protein [Burkholderiaceae bacterium]